MALGGLKEVAMVEGGGKVNVGREVEVEEKDGLDWKLAWKEFNKKHLWSGRKNAAIAQHLTIMLVFSLLPSIFDIGTDIWSGKNYIEGQTYTVNNYIYNKTNATKDITNSALGEKLTDQNNSVNAIAPKTPWNCNLAGIYTSYTEEPSYERLDCFEKDEMLGYATLGIVFLPGFFGGRRVWAGLWSSTWIPSLVIGPFFPVVIIAVKTISLLNPGDHWKKLSIRVTAAEGTWESTFQILLQLYVIFNNPRTPSTIQLLSITASLIMVIKGGIEDYLLDQPPMNGFEDTVKKMGILFPMFLTNIVFKLGCWALLATLLKFWFPLIPIVIVVIALLTGFFTKNRYLYKRFGGHAVTLRKVRMEDEEKNRIHFIFGNILWSVLSSCWVSGLVMAANLAPDTVIPGLPFLGWQDQKFGDIPIASDIHGLNTIYGIVMSCGVISAVLFYLQMFKSSKKV